MSPTPTTSISPQQPQNNNNNNNIIFSIENSSNKELGKQIRSEIDQLALNFITLDDQDKTIKREKKIIILELADKFERLHEIGEYPLPIDNICASIYKFLQRKGFDVSDRYIRDVCRENAPQYLNASYQDRNNSAIDIKIYQDEVMEAADTNANMKCELMKREQIQDLIEKCYQTIDKLEDYASEHNILVSNRLNGGGGDEDTTPHYDSQELDPFKDPVITDKPDPRESPMYNAGMRLGNAIMGFAQCVIANTKMLKDYPPSVEDLAAEIDAPKRMNEWAEWWENLTVSMKGGTDRKYRRSIFQWVKIAEDENDWGKHAASSKNPYTARFRDPKTGEWKEEIRKLTREQIGDKSPKVRKFVKTFQSLVPACVDFIKWSEYYLHPYTNGESVKLSGKLSDRSLR